MTLCLGSLQNITQAFIIKDGTSCIYRSELHIVCHNDLFISYLSFRAFILLEFELFVIHLTNFLLID